VDKSEYTLRIRDLSRIIAHPQDDQAEVQRRVKNYCSRNLMVTRHVDETDNRKPILLAPPDALTAAVIMRVFDTGLNSPHASQAAAMRMHSWRPQDFNPAYQSGDPINFPPDMPRDPAAMIWQDWQENPATAQWSLSLRWLRHKGSGETFIQGILHNAAEGILGSDLPPDNSAQWGITCELVIVLDDILERISANLAGIRAEL